MKCDICSGKIEKTFLNKLVGGYARTKSGKKKAVCPACQKKHGDKIREKL